MLLQICWKLEDIFQGSILPFHYGFQGPVIELRKVGVSSKYLYPQNHLPDYKTLTCCKTCNLWKKREESVSLTKINKKNIRKFFTGECILSCGKTKPINLHN